MSKKTETSQSFGEYVRAVRQDIRVNETYESLKKSNTGTGDHHPSEDRLVRNLGSHQSAFSAYHR